jgi:hypothetical protein
LLLLMSPSCTASQTTVYLPGTRFALRFALEAAILIIHIPE